MALAARETTGSIAQGFGVIVTLKYLNICCKGHNLPDRMS